KRRTENPWIEYERGVLWMARSDENAPGRKRPADGDPDGAQPLTKRFGYLQIGRITSSFPFLFSYQDSRARTKYVATPSSHEPDSMLLDDTKHTTFIYDLDQELAEPESTGDALVLLPLAAKMISVPNAVLSSNSAQGKELVLYKEPSSLTLPKEQDSIRKAIIESRARARASRSSTPPSTNDITRAPHTPHTETDHDDDPMDIDLD
ncbi:hypothetical protein N7478_002589, partial [Penicillium angulare]|uniref:uncharacterized protein n=1 Tax=Penicillium angulare TaxID=116970 RepID=UPI002541B451